MDTLAAFTRDRWAAGLMQVAASCADELCDGGRSPTTAAISAFFIPVRENDCRWQLFDLDMAVLELRTSVWDTGPVPKLTGCHHNLLRMRADA